MFFDEVEPVDIKGANFNPHHKLFDFSKGISNGATMILIFIPIFVMSSIMNTYLMRFISFIRFKIKTRPAFLYYIDGSFRFNENVSINENLPDYFRVL